MPDDSFSTLLLHYSKLDDQDGFCGALLSGRVATVVCLLGLGSLIKVKLRDYFLAEFFRNANIRLEWVISSHTSKSEAMISTLLQASKLPNALDGSRKGPPPSRSPRFLLRV